MMASKSRSFLLPAILPILAVLAFGCGGGGGSGDSGGSTASNKPAEKAAEAPVIDAATAATVTGKVAFNGTAPEMAMIDVSSEMTCGTKAEEHPVYHEDVVVNANGTLKNTFVYIKSGLENLHFPAPTTPVVLDQRGCQYHPHVFGVQTGQPIMIKNSDEGVLHNIHSISETSNRFNFGMPKVMETERTFKKPEIMVRIKCDVHGWMGAYCGVVDNPYYAVTGDDGTFSFPPLPPGEYVIEAWHETYGAQTQTITVSASESKDITFTYEPGS